MVVVHVREVVAVSLKDEVIVVVVAVSYMCA